MQAIILAAGKGTRMGEVNGPPKVMYKISSVPMIKYSIEHIKQSGIDNIVVVVGYQKEKVIDFLGSNVKYAVQEHQLGTGHAVMVAREKLNDLEGVLVCYGDMPLYKPETILRLIREYREHKPTIAMLSVEFAVPLSWAYGRIIRDSSQNIISIVEQKDCTPKQLLIKECNPGFYIFDTAWLKENLLKLKPENAQKEYYLTDLINIAASQHKKLIALPVSEESEVLGINTSEQLKRAERVLGKESKFGFVILTIIFFLTVLLIR